MKTQNTNISTPPRGMFRFPGAFLAACLGFMTTAAWAATPILSFDFNETTADYVKDSVNGLVGAVAGTAPIFIADSPSGQAGDRAIHFESGDYITVDDPNTKMQLDPNDPSFTLQAWVKFDGNPPDRQVFFYSNGPGGAISFSVNPDRTVFVTTLGILDAESAAAIPDDGKWHHIDVVHQNGVELRYYVDGVLGDMRAYTSGVIFTRTQTYFSLGAEWNGGYQYIGSLDRLKITSGILTPDQFDSKPQLAVPTLSGARTATGMTITFTGTLQSAAAVTGPWTDVAGATSPAPITFTGTERHFRAKQ